MAGRPLAFPQEVPTHFRVFIEYLRTGRLRHPNLREMTASKHYFRFLAELFAFAGTFDAHAMRNAILDTFFLRILTSPNQLPYENIRDVYENTSRNSSLRDLVIDVVVNTGTGDLLQMWRNDLPRTFLVDCLKMAEEDGIVPFKKSGRHGTTLWMEGKRENICAHYHVHVEEEERAAGERSDEVDVEMNRDEEEESEGGEYEASEKTKRELAFIEDLKSLRVRY